MMRLFGYIKYLFVRIKNYLFPQQYIELNSWDPLIFKLESN